MMEPIFLNNLIPQSVKSQQELEDIFATYPHLSRLYIQTAVYMKETREWYEDNWPKVYKYLDKDFLDQFRLETEHRARAWEFYLAVVLLRYGFLLQEKTWKFGPDFCIELSSQKRIWVEAVTCGRGEVDPVEPYPLMESGKMYSFSGNIEDVNRPRALRITSAVAEKLEQFKKYLARSAESRVDVGDYLVVAVNGFLIQHLTEPGMLFKRAVFGQGPDVFVNIPGKDELEGGYYKSVPTIPKTAGTKQYNIPATFMEMDEFSILSAVLYCGNTISSCLLNGYPIGDDFLFAYHSNPNNSIPDGTFRFGRGIRKDSMGQITDISQK